MASMTSQHAGLLGAQRPRVLSLPPGADRLSTAGDDAVDLAQMAGLSLYPWQQLVLRESLRELPGGRWAAFEVGLVVPRQNGKGSVLEALELSALFLSDPNGPPPLILHSAHEFKTSAEHFRRVRDLVEGSDTLRKQVRKVFTASGAESIELQSGARLRFVTRTGGSGRGFSADLVVIDEAYNLTAEQMAAVLPTLSARPNPQVWYTSSAGMVTSDQLAHLRRRGIEGGDPSLVYLEWSAADGADLDDHAAWAEANPSLGYRIPESFVVAERAALPDEQFGRERLGLWAGADPGTGLDISRWKTLADDTAERGGSQVFGLSTAPDRSWAAISVAWRRPDGDVQVMLADYRETTAWVKPRLEELGARWGGRVLTDPESRDLFEDAETVPLARAEATLDDEITAGTVHHGNETALNVAVKGARWRKSGDSRVLDRKGSLEISPVVAASLAVHGVVTGDDAPPNLW